MNTSDLNPAVTPKEAMDVFINFYIVSVVSHYKLNKSN